MKTLLIVNPACGQGRLRSQWPQLVHLLRDLGLTFELAITTRPGDATTLAREGLKSGFRRLVAAGGDGTFNEVANGFFEDGAPIAPDAVLAPLSFGTGCDLARSLGAPKGLAAAARLPHGQATPIDLGCATFLDNQGNPTQRFFLNYADLVLGGETIRCVRRLPKAMGGFLTFLVGSTVSLMTQQSKHLRLIVDGKPAFEGEVALAVVSNGSYFGGGMHIAPTADPRDGLFDVVILHSLTRRALIWNLPRVYRGTHISDPRVLRLRGRRVEVTSDDRVLIGMDGEQPGMANACFEIVPRALLLQV